MFSEVLFTNSFFVLEKWFFLILAGLHLFESRKAPAVSKFFVVEYLLRVGCALYREELLQTYVGLNDDISMLVI